MPEVHVIDTPAPRRSRWRADAVGVLLLAVGCYAFSSAVDLSEKIEHWLARSEGWQADELPLTLTVLAAALTWFAVRRRNETLAELRARESAEARVQGLLAHNRELARQLIAVQESERRALARELHDDLGQACSAIRVETAYIRHCNHGAHAGIAAAAERAEAEAQRLYGQVRDMLRRLRPVELDSLGLLAALQALCEAWEARSGVACSFHHEGALPASGDALDITVYRVAQEALSNVMRHAQASAVRLRLKGTPNELVLTVQDDGCGVDLQAQPGRPRQGLGLLGAAERAAALGGRLLVESAPGAGLRLQLHLPLAPQAAAA